ncbi:MAG: lysylphosphatidylglycerol synthase domain-containing protein [Alphaproteobacteria bacterium]
MLYITGILGIGLAAYLIVDAGAETVLSAMATIGWGLVAVTLFHLLPMGLSTMSWREMFPIRQRLKFTVLIWARWIRESVNSLLPVGQVGGDVVCARLIHLKGTAGPLNAATMIVDLTVGVLTQLTFIVLGLVLLVSQSTNPDILEPVTNILFGLALVLCATFAFLFVQIRGFFGRMAHATSRLFGTTALIRMASKVSEVDEAVGAIYARKRKLVRANLWRLAGWIAGTGEIWLLMQFLGKPVSLTEAFILESLGSGVRAIAFLVPGAIGVLESSYVVFGSMFGIAPSDALAIALGKRVREIALGVPGLAAWQIAEGRRLI